MTRLLLFFSAIPFFGVAQSFSPTKAMITKGFSQAIEDYIKAEYKKDKTKYDTLFFGKHKEFPDIALPPVIENTKIMVITPEEADRKRKNNKSMVYINMFGWFSKDQTEFLMVTFFPGYTHQYDYSINYKYNSKTEAFEMGNIQFKNFDGK